MSLLTFPWSQLLNANGDTYPGAKLYFYETGTNTLATTYTDAALSVPHANPVVADSQGVFAPIYLASRPYKTILRSSVDVTLFSADPVSGGGGTVTVATIATMQAITSPVSGASVTVTEEGRGGTFVYDATRVAENDGGTVFDGWVRRYSGALNVKWFGATGIGENDTDAIQDAVDAAYALSASTLGGGTVYVPPGEYGVETVSLVFTNTRTVKIQGAGRLATVFKKIDTTTTPVFDFISGLAADGFPVPSVPNQSCDFADFCIIGNGVSPTTGTNPGIRLSLMTGCTVNSVAVYFCSTAVDLVGAISVSLNDCMLASNQTGLMARKYFVAGFAGDGIFANLIRVNECTLQRNSTWGIDLAHGDQFIVEGCAIESNGTLGNPATGAMIIRDTTTGENSLATCTIENVWFESNRGRAIEVEDATGFSLFLNNCRTFSKPGEGGGIVNVGAIRNLFIICFPLQIMGAELISNAIRTIIIGERPAVFTDNSNTTIVNQSISTLSLRLKSIAEPSTDANYGQLYVHSVDDVLKFKNTDGLVSVVALQSAEEVAVAKVLTASDSGKLFFLRQNGGFTVTLPLPALGLKYNFVVMSPPTTGSYVITTNAGANLLWGLHQDVLGDMVSFAAQDTINFVAGTSLYSDRLEVVSDGNGWHCQAFSGADGGITTSAT